MSWTVKVGFSRRRLLNAVYAVVWISSLLCTSTGFAEESNVVSRLEALDESSVTFKTTIFRGRNVLSNIPDKSRALVYLFHGSGVSVKFVQRNHTQVVADALLSKGYALVASESKLRTGKKRWDNKSADPETNVDIKDMLALHEHLIANTAITEDTPVYTMGMSNGGGFSGLFGYVASANGVPVHGIANYMGPVPFASKSLFDRGVPFPPYFVVLGEQDGLVISANVVKAVEKLTRANTSTELHLVSERAVTTEALMELGYTTPQGAGKLMEFLRKEGHIDVDGNRLFHSGDVLKRKYLRELGQEMLAAGLSRPDLNAVVIVWAGHHMRSDYVDQQVAFFEQHLTEN